jgi:hypothetical protein
MEQLRNMERGGYIENVNQLVESRDQQSQYTDRGDGMYGKHRTKDLIETFHEWEWKDGKIQRTIIGNRKVLLSKQQASPFDHGEYPFVISTSMPMLFNAWGKSTVELVEKLQEMLWTLQSQRLDNIELINNAILLIRADLDDAEAFDWHPGARWAVNSPNDVESFQPPYQLATLTLEAESFLKSDLQNVTSATPLAGGNSDQIDQNTATGVSIIMSNAQKALKARKHQSMKAIVREANHRLKNCQQFISDERLVHIVGPYGVDAFRSISREDILGDFLFKIDATSDSLHQQERRAEATQWLQVLGGMAPLFAASGTPLDMRELLLWAAKKWDINDAEKFFTSAPVGPAQQDAGAPGGGGAPGGAPPGAPNMGITSDTAVDASSPSATGGISGSPQQFMQRSLAMAGAGKGGAMNATGG